METILYVPYPLGIDERWDSTEDLCRYLLLSPKERQRLQEMADQQAWTGMIGGVVWIYHKCSEPLYLHYQQTDNDFQLQLLCLIYSRSFQQKTSSQ